MVSLKKKDNIKNIYSHVRPLRKVQWMDGSFMYSNTDDLIVLKLGRSGECRFLDSTDWVKDKAQTHILTVSQVLMKDSASISGSRVYVLSTVMAHFREYSTSIICLTHLKFLL